MVLDHLRRAVQSLGRPTPVHPGHVYEVPVTDDRIRVNSVGKLTTVERMSDEKEVRVRLEDLRDGIDTGIVVHDEQRCPECR